MQPNLPEAKQAIRARVRADLKKMSPADRAIDSARARALLTGQAVWRDARSILFFAPLPDELDLWPLLAEVLAAGKTAALPQFDAATGGYAACRVQEAGPDLAVGRFGIREPVKSCPRIAERLDLILVPGVAFDLKGGRLGRGAGYYDRLLASVAGRRCAVAFDGQIVDNLPVESHDREMDYILTPTRWIEV